MNEATNAILPLDDKKTEFLVKLNGDRVSSLEGSLEKNWIAHLLLAAVGLALVLHIGNLKDLVMNYFVKGQYDEKAVALVFLAILLYHFMKLGHLLTLYVESSLLHQQMLQRFLGAQVDQKAVMLRKSTNFFVEAFFSIESVPAVNVFWPYILVTTTVVSLAQSSALFLVDQAFAMSPWLPCCVAGLYLFVLFIFMLIRNAEDSEDPSEAKTLRIIGGVMSLLYGFFTLRMAVANGAASLILLVSGALMTTLYMLFWSSKRMYPQTTIVVALSPCLAVIWLALFAIAHP